MILLPVWILLATVVLLVWIARMHTCMIVRLRDRVEALERAPRVFFAVDLGAESCAAAIVELPAPGNDALPLASPGPAEGRA